MFTFQSRARTLDLQSSTKVYTFRNYTFVTADENVAAFLRRNAEKNPHILWELVAPDPTPANVIAEVAEETGPKRRGRPRKSEVQMVRGTRTSEETQKE